MSSLRPTAALAILGALSGCVYALPPTSLEVGGGITSHRQTPILHGAAGVHLASALPRPVPFDVGLGYGIDGSDRDGVVAHGPYLDLAYLHGDRVRWQAGARAQLDLSDAGGNMLVARAALEWSKPSDKPLAQTDRCGSSRGRAVGRLAIGGYLEAGPRWPPRDATGWVVTAGVTLRGPAAYGTGFALPGCDAATEDNDDLGRAIDAGPAHPPKRTPGP